MAGPNDINGKIEINATPAIKAIDKVITQLAQLGTAFPMVATATDKMEKSLVKAMGSLKGVSGGLREAGNAAQTAAKQQKMYDDQLTRQGEGIYKNRVAQAQAANKQMVTDEQTARAAELAALRGAIQERYSLESSASKTRYAQARDANKQIVSDERASRQAELSALRQSIQGRYATEASSARTRVTDAQRTNRQLVADETAANRARINSLRTAILERDRLQQQSSKAQIQYAAEASRQGAAYGQEIVSGGLGNARYALYDVASTWGAVAVATLGAAAAVETVGIAYEKAFAQVERTTGVAGSAASDLKQQLIDITTVVPSSFQDVAGIAALGGQLGIAADGITTFTDVVAKLTATTDLSSQAAGTALGRFQALLGTSTDQFDNLGSSILRVGVNSVATETQIVNTATQISSMGSFAGLTADQVIGLSGALASVGTQPELARGTVTRTFTQISKAVSEGGAQLDLFAKLSGTSSREFAQAWGTDKFADTFQNLLKGIHAAGGDSVAVLKELGITSVRDVPALLRLAGAQGVVERAFSDAKAGFADNTELNRQFGIVADTTAAKLTEFANTIKGAFSQFANTGAVKAAVEVVLSLANAFLQFARNPIGKVFLTLAAAVTVAVGAFAAFQATMALTRATTYAMATANAAMTTSTVAGSGAVSGLTKQFALLSLGQTRAAAASAAYRASIAAGTGQTRAYGSALVAAGRAASGFGAATRLALSGLGIGVAITALVAGVNAIGNAMKSASAKAKDYYGDTSSLADALKADTQVYNNTGAAIRTSTASVTQSNQKLADWAVQLGSATGGQVQLNSATGTTTKSIMEQTVAIGQSTTQALANILINNEKFQKSWQENGAAVEAAGGSLQELFNAMLAGDQGGSQYLDDLSKKYETLVQSQYGVQNSTTVLTAAQKEQYAAVTDIRSGLLGLRNGVKSADTVLADNIKTVQFATDVNKAAGISAEAASAGYGEFGEGAEDANTSLSQLINTALAGTDGLLAIGNAAYSLGQSLADNGKVFDLYSASGRANFGALQQTITTMVAAAGDNSSALAAYLQGLMQSLVNFGVTGADALNYVRAALDATGNASVSTEALTAAVNTTSIALDQGYSAALQKAANSANRSAGATKKAGDAAEKAGKQVRTMKDYVDDLSSVLDRAFELRFEVQDAKDAIADAIAEIKQGIKDAAKKEPLSIADFFAKKNSKGEAKDAIRSTYYDLVQASKDAQQAVKDANAAIKQSMADLSGLKADRSVLEYQLMVARAYGDTARAAQIQAELAKNTADTADAQAELNKQKQEAKDAQNSQNKTLKGNSKVAVKNRADVRSLQGGYVDYIQSLIDAGASQKTINKAIKQSKADFLAQGRALGYSDAELAAYAATFDDFGDAQDKASKGTDKNTASARDNRDAMSTLTQAWQDYIQALIDSGAPASVVNDAIKDGEDNLKKQGEQMGMTKNQVKPYVEQLKSIPTAIRKIPKDITVKFNKPSVSPIAQALAEYKARHKKDSVTVNTKLDRSGITNGINSYPRKNIKVGTLKPTKLDTPKNMLLHAAGVDTRNFYVDKNVNVGGNMWVDGSLGNGKTRNTAHQATGGVVPRFLASGGSSLTHPGKAAGTDTIPAWLTPGEFVQRRAAVDYYGVPFMNALNNMQIPRYLSSGGPTVSAPSGGGGTGIQLVELLPTQLNQIVQGVSTQIMLDGHVLANSVNSNNSRQNSLGRG